MRWTWTSRWTRKSPRAIQEASVVKFVNQIIWEAFKNRATDIHFEPQEDELPHPATALTASSFTFRCRTR